MTGGLICTVNCAIMAKKGGEAMSLLKNSEILKLPTPDGEKTFYVMGFFDFKERRYIALMPLFGDRVAIWHYRYEKHENEDGQRGYMISSPSSKEELAEVREFYDNSVGGGV